VALEELLTHTFTFLPTPLVGATRVDRLERYLNTLVESCHPAGLPSSLCSFLKNSIPPHIDHCHACTHNQSERTSAAFAFSRRLSAETTLSTLSDS